MISEATKDDDNRKDRAVPAPTDIGRKRYQKAYGAWAGLPKGNPPDYSRCCEEVHSRDRWTKFYQCTKPRGHGPDGAYCKQHDPAAVQARRTASDARWNEKWNAERYQWHARSFFDALVKIAEGHNDARGLAQEVIAEFKSGERPTTRTETMTVTAERADTDPS
jgi:hypothetical protein